SILIKGQKEVTGGVFSLYSRTCQMVIAQFLVNIDTACQIKKQNKEKCLYPLMWPKKGGSVEKEPIVLPK
ncbi:MAG: hypothetical protein P0S93_02755, partial [Candidatus Neptunochlamydia sp.]|nr:hypothetical protein [Candidatus Neptunochlamydia sp.]